MMKMVAVQTRQGTWVRREDGALDPVRQVNVAQVYAPPSDEVAGATLGARFESSEKMMLQTARLLASAPEMAQVLSAMLALWERGPSVDSPEAAGRAMFEAGILDAARAALLKSGAR